MITAACTTLAQEYFKHNCRIPRNSHSRFERLATSSAVAPVYNVQKTYRYHTVSDSEPLPGDFELQGIRQLLHILISLSLSNPFLYSIYCILQYYTNILLNYNI